MKHQRGTTASLGGQIQTRFRINSRLHLSLYGAGINFSHADPIAAAYPGTSNTYVTDAGGTVTGFAGKFAYLDAILKLEMDTDKRFPPRFSSTLSTT